MILGVEAEEDVLRQGLWMQPGQGAQGIEDRVVRQTGVGMLQQPRCHGAGGHGEEGQRPAHGTRAVACGALDHTVP